MVAPKNFQLVSIDSGTSATFSWEPVDHNSMNGPHKGYKVYHWKGVGGSPAQMLFLRRLKRQTNNCLCPEISTCKEAVFGSSASSGTINDMHADGVNYAYIVTFNDKHESPCSETINITMPIGKPEAVEDFNLHAVRPNELVATWEEPKNANGPLSEYKITRCEVHDGYVDTSTCVEAQPRQPDPTRAAMQASITGLKPNQEYEVTVVPKTTGGPHAGEGIESKMRAKTLPKDVPRSASPYPPEVHIINVGDDHINATWLPGRFDPGDPRSPGEAHMFAYRVEGDDEWQKVPPEQTDDFHATLHGLDPDTKYEVMAISQVRDPNTNEVYQAESMVVHVRTQGGLARAMSWWWLIVVIIIICILILILCIVCAVVRNRGQRYPVSEKEREQGREPMLAAEERQFGEYAGRGPAGERASLASGKPESETDSMAEYGEGDAGRFTEDGSFIGAYTPSNKLTVATAPDTKQAPSTFV